MNTVLLTEDDEAICEVVKLYLGLAHYDVAVAHTAAEARARCAQKRPDIALVDIMLPGGEDGFSLGEELIGDNIPVMFLTARTAVSDRVRGLRMGAYDYVLKPFEPAELLARIENVLRRRPGPTSVLEYGALRLDTLSREAALGGEPLALTAMEYELLALMMENPGIAFSREKLLAMVWGYDFMGETRTVDVHVQRLRAKIGPDYIQTVYKYGYRFGDGHEK